MSIEQAKNSVAQQMGYPDWETFENWVIDHNKPVNVAILIRSAMERVIICILNES